MLFSNCKSNTQVSCVCVTWMGGVIMLSVPEYSQTWLKKPIRVYGRNNWEWIVKFSCLFSHEIPGELFIVQSGNYCNDLKTTGRVTGGYICVSGYSSNPWTNAVRKKRRKKMWHNFVIGERLGVRAGSFEVEQGLLSYQAGSDFWGTSMRTSLCGEAGSLPRSRELAPNSWIYFCFLCRCFPGSSKRSMHAWLT